jgi:hypothetical protein
VYDPAAGAWTDLSAALSGTPPSLRRYHGFTSAGGKLYVHGGYDDSGESDAGQAEGVGIATHLLHTVGCTGNWVGCSPPASHQGESVNGSWALLAFRGHEEPSHLPEAFTPSRFRLYMYPFLLEHIPRPSCQSGTYPHGAPPSVLLSVY